MFTSIETPSGPIGVHLNLAKAPTVVPGPERHKWNVSRPPRGQYAHCLKCGLRSYHQYNYITVYAQPGEPSFRPGPMPRCTGEPQAPTPTV